MKEDGILRSEYAIQPCYQDLVTFTIGHTNYDEDTPILIDAEHPENHVTLAYARQFVRKLIGSMKAKGVESGHVVCLHMFNSIIYPLLALAVIGTGARVTGANPAYTATELCHHFQVSSTTHVVTCVEKESVAREASEGVHSIKCPLFGPVERIARIIENTTPHAWVEFDNRHEAVNTVAFLNSTSGTTGLPKMAARSHFSIVMENMAIHDTAPKDYQEKRLLSTPFFHGFTLPLAIIAALRHGIPTFVMRRFEKQTFLSAISNYEITETAMPPPMLINFSNMEASERKALRSLRKIWSGGAPLRQETQQTARAMFHPEACINQVWGMTEGGWMTTFQHPENDKSGSVGRLIGTYEACVLVTNDEGYNVPVREHDVPGEIAVRGPINMLHYHNNPEATADLIDKDGWLRTGDVGHIDSTGRFFIVERKKDLIKVRGWQVSPAEIESRLLSHPAVLDAAVVGVQHHNVDSEVPRMFVVLLKPGSLVVADLKAFLLQTLVKYKVEDAEVCYVNSIPKSASGKILKNELRKTHGLPMKNGVSAE